MRMLQNKNAAGTRSSAQSHWRILIILGLASVWPSSESGISSQTPVYWESSELLLLVNARETNHLAQITYSPSQDALPNPERGFYYMAECEGRISIEQLRVWRQKEGITLVVCSVDLSSFLDSRIDPETMQQFDANMATVRAAGMKTILRFSYSADTSGIDADRTQIAEHIDQIKPYLEKHKDVIAVVQAGFIGGWGEWAYSKHFGTLGKLTERNWNDRSAVVDMLLRAVPSDRMVQLRTPDYKRRFAGAKPLQQAEAFSGTAKARLGHHNDCFLASANDWGTYINRTVEYPYLESETRYVAMGGETCNLEPQRSNCKTALNELSRFHYSYLNASYHPDVLNAFKTQGCFDEIQRKLGYRFVLKQGQFSNQAQAGGILPIGLLIRNDGWAAPFNKHDAEVVLRNVSSQATFRFKLETDVRHWQPDRDIVLRQNISLPRNLAEGRYELLLNLPDPDESLQGRPDYSIRLAIRDGWEKDTGFNRLNHFVEITIPEMKGVMRP